MRFSTQRKKGKIEKYWAILIILVGLKTKTEVKNFGGGGNKVCHGS
jgi:hypothetical protein